MCTGLCGRGSALPGPHLGMLSKTPQGSSTLLPSGPLPWILRKLSKAVFWHRLKPVGQIDLLIFPVAFSVQ